MFWSESMIISTAILYLLSKGKKLPMNVKQRKPMPPPTKNMGNPKKEMELERQKWKQNEDDDDWYEQYEEYSD